MRLKLLTYSVEYQQDARIIQLSQQTLSIHIDLYFNIYRYLYV